MARGLLVAGRVLLACVVLWVVACRLTEPQWRSAPQDAGGVPEDPLVQAGLGVALVASLLLPLLVAPIGSSWLAVPDARRLRVPTVLGTRSVALGEARVRALRPPGGGWSTWFFLVRDDAGRWLVVAHSELRRLPAGVRAALVGDPAEPGRLSPSARIGLGVGTGSRAERRRVAWVGWLAVLLNSCAMLLAIGLLTVLAGLEVG